MPPIDRILDTVDRAYGSEGGEGKEMIEGGPASGVHLSIRREHSTRLEERITIIIDHLSHLRCLHLNVLPLNLHPSYQSTAYHLHLLRGTESSE